jgi:hypothetical protein
MYSVRLEVGNPTNAGAFQREIRQGMKTRLHELVEVMGTFGIRDGYDNMKRLGEYLRYNDSWFQWIEEQLEQLETEATLETVGRELARRKMIGPDGAVVTF